MVSNFSPISPSQTAIEPEQQAKMGKREDEAISEGWRSMASPIDGRAKTRRKIQIFALSDDVQRLLEVYLFRGPEALT